MNFNFLLIKCFINGIWIKIVEFNLIFFLIGGLIVGSFGVHMCPLAWIRLRAWIVYLKTSDVNSKASGFRIFISAVINIR